MNLNNLHELINRYEENFYMVNNDDHNEIFKWKAIKRFQDVWFSKDAATMNFAELFNKAKSEFSVLVDNKMVSPANGVVKIAEKKPDEVKKLFTDVLFVDDGGNLNTRQNHIDEFLVGMEKLRGQTFPNSWKYKQDRHSASCYLVMVKPEENFIYKYKPVETFARYVEFGKNIGSGETFKLEHYYELGEIVVNALKEHSTLLEKHFALIDDEHYRDKSLHTLAFDIIYCCDSYNFYNGLVHKAKAESVKAYKLEELRLKEEMEKQAEIDNLNEQIRELEMRVEPYANISLLNVQVSMRGLGNGVVINQNENRVTVQFENCTKDYCISRKYFVRPVFEDNEEILEAFTEYEKILSEIKTLKNRIKAIK